MLIYSIINRIFSCLKALFSILLYFIEPKCSTLICYCWNLVKISTYLKLFSLCLIVEVVLNLRFFVNLVSFFDSFFVILFVIFYFWYYCLRLVDCYFINLFLASFIISYYLLNLIFIIPLSFNFDTSSSISILTTGVYQLFYQISIIICF